MLCPCSVIGKCSTGYTCNVTVVWLMDTCTLPMVGDITYLATYISVSDTGNAEMVPITSTLNVMV